MVEVGAPARLRDLASWQAGRVATLGARLTGQRMPLEARADFAVLAALEEFGPSSQADLGRRLGLDRANVNQVVTRLELADHLQRRPDPDDRRRLTVEITGRGVRHLGELETHAAAVQDELLAALDPGQREELRRLLAAVLSAHPAQPA